MKKVAIYIRVSTLKQETGLDSQENAILEYCRNHGIQDYKIYKDRQTGGNLDRPALKQLQNDIFRGRINTVIVWKLDRLSRSLKDGINLLVDWLERDIRVVAIAQNFDLSGSVGKIIMSMLLGIAEMERTNIKENIVRGIHTAKSKGIKIGGSEPTYNYDEIISLKSQGMSVSGIARYLSCSRQTVYTALKQGQQMSA